MGERRRARELAVQVLFHLEFNLDDPSETFQLICDTFSPKKSVRPFARDLVMGVCKNKASLDQIIRKASKNWRMERMTHVDKSILRLAVFELLFLEDIPPRVSLDEAVELGKKFGSENSARYINGVLDHIYTTLGIDSTGEKG
jgi:transcription antitermination factor NusB